MLSKRAEGYFATHTKRHTAIEASQHPSIQPTSACTSPGDTLVGLQNWHKRTLEGRFVVQCDEIINVHKPIKERLVALSFA